MTITRQQIVEAARKYKGAKYRHQGRSKITGIDCAGLLAGIADEFGFKYTDQFRYGRNAERFKLREEMDKRLVKVKKEDLQPGDMLLLKIDIVPQHTAIVSDYYLGGLGMIHCYDRVKKVVEHRLAKIWLARVVQVYRFPGVREDATWQE